MKEAQAIQLLEARKEPKTLPPLKESNNVNTITLALIKSALELTEGSGYETPARKLVWGLTELIKAGALQHQHSLQDMQKLDKRTMDKAQLICLIDEFEDQKLERNSTKRDFLKLRDEMAVQHQATFKQVVGINEKLTSHVDTITTHNQKVKTILIQINELFEHLDQSLLKCSEADGINNKALRRIISDTAEIRALLKGLDLNFPPTRCLTDPDEMGIGVEDKDHRNPTEGKADNPITIHSQTQPVVEKVINPRKGVQPKEKGRVTGGGTTKWKPEVVPDPAMDAEALGLKPTLNDM